jgi:hypothetical protein
LKVSHPQLEYSVSEQRAGRKRFDVHKNEESSGLSYGYPLSHAGKKSYPEDPSVAYPLQGDYQDPSKYSPYKAGEAKGGSLRDSSYPYYGASQGNPSNPSNPPNYQNYQNYPNYPSNPSQGPKYDAEVQYENNYEDRPSNDSFRDVRAGGQYEDAKFQPTQDYPRHQDESLKARPSEEPKQGEYYDEIEKLKEELRRKEEELATYNQNFNKTPTKQVESQEAIYSRINKAMFDKQRIEDQRKINSSTLDYQLNEKNRMKSLYQQEKDREQAMRLEMLKKLKEDEAFERMEKLRRAKEYREQLEVQNLVKSNIRNQERMFQRNDLPKPFEAPPQNYEPIRSNNSNSNLGYSPASFTKKTPKTICYNPITGVLKDTAQYVYGSFPSYNLKDPSITYLKNQSNIPELAAHPAFQQVKFTKNHPKVVPSFPVTGNPMSQAPFDVRDEEIEAYKNQEGRMAEYGQLMMKNS